MKLKTQTKLVLFIYINQLTSQDQVRSSLKSPKPRPNLKFSMGLTLEPYPTPTSRVWVLIGYRSGTCKDC